MEPHWFYYGAEGAEVYRFRDFQCCLLKHIDIGIAKPTCCSFLEPSRVSRAFAKFSQGVLRRLT